MAYLALLRKRRQTRLNSDLDPALRFHCNEGFSVSKCEEELARLRNVLADFDLRTLGEWTWILVRSEDWKPILRQVGRDPDSPAFTILAARQTFLEEALFDPDPLRSRTLLERFRMPLDKLLPFAVAHELAHDHVHTHEQRQRNEGEEVDRAGGLVAAENVEQSRKGSRKRRRHRQTRQQHHRRGDEDHQRVRRLLKHPVLGTTAGGRDPEVDVIDDVPPDMTDRRIVWPG